MKLNETELKIIKHVVHQFLTARKSVPRRRLVSALKSPDTINLLTSCAVLRQDQNEQILPMLLAFEYCGDEETRFQAQRAVGVVLRTLHNLYEVETEKTEFSSLEVESHARKLYGSIEPSDIQLGLYLSQEFGYFGRSGGSDVEITKLNIAERIVTLDDTDSYWGQYVKRVSMHLKREHEFDRIANNQPSADAVEQTNVQPILPGSGPEPLIVKKEEQPMIFLGHGRNSLWARVHMHLKDELSLKVDAWESESRVGRHAIEVLKNSLASCSFAVMVVTAEDKTADGKERARQNVIHEIGLFQGKLGFERVALLQQDGIEEFTNIAGLQVVKFTDGDIQAAFYELDRTLKREGIIK